MTTDTIEIRKITPSEGMFLTDGETVAEGPVYLGKHDSADNWREITAEEKAKIDAERAAKFEAEKAEAAAKAAAAQSEDAP